MKVTDVNKEDINYPYLITFPKTDLIELILDQSKIIDNLGNKIVRLEEQKCLTTLEGPVRTGGTGNRYSLGSANRNHCGKRKS